MHHAPLDREWEPIEDLREFWSDLAGQRALFLPLPLLSVVLEWVGRGSFLPGVPGRWWRLTLADLDGIFPGMVEGCCPKEEEHFPAMWAARRMRGSLGSAPKHSHSHVRWVAYRR